VIVVRARTMQLLASVLLAVAVLGTVGVCETRAASPASDRPAPLAGDRHAAIAAPAADTVAAPSLAPAPPHALTPFALVAALAPPLPFAARSAAPRADAAPRTIPLYLRDRALLL
jgi:hypothetical protein